MNRALLDLIVLSVRGRLVRRIRLLRQPRYLAATLAGIFYFVLVLGPRLLPGRHARTLPAGLSGGAYDSALHLGFGLVIAVVVTSAWLLVSPKPALRLSETEIDFLLPSPLPRWQIILYSLLRQQPGLLASTLVLLVVRGGRTGGWSLPGLLGLWALLTLADLHWKGISLWKARLQEIPLAASAWRRGTAIALGAAWWIALLTALGSAFRAVDRSPGGRGSPGLAVDPGRFLLNLAEAVDRGVAGTLLAPFAWLTTPLSGAVLPTAAGLFLLAALMALHVAWVVRSRASFEEATLERARRESARKGVSKQELRARSARHREPFHLAPSGRPETAILWKNLMLRGRAPLAWSLAVLGGTLVFAAVAAAFFPDIAGVVLMIGGLSLLCGIPLIAGIMLRNDLRVDLLHADVLRTWPLRGERLVLAELLAPALNVLLILLFGCGLLMAATLGQAVGGGTGFGQVIPRQVFLGVPPLAGMPVLLASALLVGMAIALLSLVVQNLAALMLPSWVGLGMTRRRGTAMVGQRLLVSLGHLLAMLLGALPALLVLGAVAGLHALRQRPVHLWEVPVLAVVIAVLLGVEVMVLAQFAGRLWDRLDPSQEIFAAMEE